MNLKTTAACSAGLTPANAAMTPADSPCELLAFKPGAEEYGIDILRVQDIRSYEWPTLIANAPPFIKGVTNLRGVIVVDIEKPMSGAEMGPGKQTLQ